jgi:hypothetical protein
VERDEHYFLMRAEEEEAKAAATGDPAVKDCHLRMAGVYRRSAFDGCSRSLGDCELTSPRPIPS